MTYDKLIRKIADLQGKIGPALASAEDAGLQDEDTRAKLEAAERWMESAPKKLGEAEVARDVPDITPLVELSNRLFTYQNAFEPHIRSLIEEYREYVQRLFELVEEADVKPM